ncbi:amino acid permease [Tsukamurella serpentis]
MAEAPPLKKALSERQLRMIAIGGVIGAGLFVGSGVVIRSTGPGAFLTYAMAGVLVVMVMRMLAEMAVANPTTGAFADYARAALGDWAGFSVGWLYWYFWVIVVGFEAIAGAKIIRYWLPGVPIWSTALLLLVLMTATNLFSVTSFGEFEFWFAGIKVAAIVVFLVLGSCFVLGLWPNTSMDLSNLTDHGGFFPLGVSAVTVGVVTTIFSMVGAEIATIAAAESENPERAVTRAANSVIARIVIFFVGSALILALILPWNGPEIAASPFVSAFNRMGIGGAEHIMNAVVLTAVLSCLNAGMYTASRMLFVLAARHEAPARLVRISRRGVPVTAILASSVIGLLCVIAASFWERSIFEFLLNSSGAIILFVYLLIAISQIVLRLRNGSDRLTVKMWLFPFLSIATVVAMLAVLVQMYLDQAVRTQLVLSLCAWLVVLVLYAANRRFIASRRPVTAGPPSGPVTEPEPRAERILVLAERAVHSDALADALAGALTGAPAGPHTGSRTTGTGAPMVHLVVPQNPRHPSRDDLRSTLEAVRRLGLSADGEIGDERPMRALAAAIGEFQPDRLVISTLAADASDWRRFEVVDRIRAQYRLPVVEVPADDAVDEDSGETTEGSPA